MKLLVSAFLLPALGCLATAKVVAFAGTCDKFFLKKEPPTGPTGTQYKEICQKRDQAGNYEFATLYDTSKKIPVYSAYEYQGYLKCNRDTPWYIEPQLDDQNGGAEMNTEGSVKQNLGVHQALNGDYLHSGYDKGHLLPVQHRNAQQCSDATFTLTNAAPQHKTFNRGVWRVTEENVANKLDTDCLKNSFHAYVVTGVVPGTKPPIKGNVNIPDYFWSAYCCVDNNNVPKLSGAFYGYNDDSKRKPTETTVDGLKSWFQGFQGWAGFRVFGNNC